MYKPRLKGLFHVSDIRGESDYSMGKVIRLEISGEILRPYQGKVILYRNHFSFLMEVIVRSHPNAAGGGRVLDNLEFLNEA